MEKGSDPLLDPLLDPGTLNRELGGAAPPLVLDVRPAELFAKDHIPSALHLDLWGISLIDTDPAPLRAFMWMIGHLFSLRGVTPDRAVVVYEDDSGVRAARAFWFLEYLGHPNVRILDGGLNAWRAHALPTTRDASSPSPSQWHGTPQPARLATRQQVMDRIGASDVTIVDTRSDAEYYGEEVRARQGGAVPGAVHLEWKRNLTADGAFKPAAELAAMYAAAGVTPDRETIAYCQGGYRAAHTYVALRLLGYRRVRNYVGSWKEWGDHDATPIDHPRRPPSS